VFTSGRFSKNILLYKYKTVAFVVSVIFKNKFPTLNENLKFNQSVKNFYSRFLIHFNELLIQFNISKQRLMLESDLVKKWPLNFTKSSR
jgi:hypothetical protein